MTGTSSRWTLRLIAFAYLALLLIMPVGLVFWRTFQHGFAPFWDAISNEAALHALKVTLQVALAAVVCNTVFGVVASLLIVRHDFPGKRIFNVLIDLPLAISPVVVGLAIILVYGRLTPIGEWFGNRGIDIVYALPGMVIATVFVSLPLVVRELVPVLEEIGTEQEQAAWTLGASAVQTFRKITLPAIRWALAYGVVLSLARSLGEFGAVAVVSGKLKGQTQTLTLYVEQQFNGFQKADAYSVSVLLAFIAIVALIAMTVFRPGEAQGGRAVSGRSTAQKRRRAPEARSRIEKDS